MGLGGLNQGEAASRAGDFRNPIDHHAEGSMDRSLETQALRYFGIFKEAFVSIDTARGRIADAMTNFIDEASRSVRRSRIVPYVKHRLPDGRPWRLYTGLLFEPSSTSRPTRAWGTERTIWTRHLASPSTSKRNYTHARQAARGTALAANETKRDFLNRLSHQAATALLWLQAALRQSLRGTHPPPELEAIPPHARPGPLPTIPPAATRLAWRFSTLVAEFDLHLIHLAELYNETPRDPSITLNFEQHENPFTVELPWVLARHGIHYGKLTDKDLRRMRIPKSTRAEIRTVEKRRRPLLLKRLKLGKLMERVNSRIASDATSTLRELDRALTLPSPGAA